MMVKIKFYLLLIFNISLIHNISIANTNTTPDSIRLLREQGKLREAKTAVSDWIKSTTNEFGDNSIEVVIPLLSSSELSIIHYEYHDAIKSLERAIKIMDASSGWLYPDYALALNYLAFCKVNIGDAFAAFPIINEAEMIYFKTLSQDHPDFNLCNMNRAILHLHLGEFQKSEDYFLKSYEFAKSKKNPLLKSSAKSTAISPDWLHIQFSKLYIKWYKPEKALPLLQKAQGNLIEEGKNKSPIYATLLETLGSYYYHTNDYKMAFTFYTELVEHRKKYFGEGHFATLMAYLEMGELMTQKGYLDKALENFLIVEKSIDKVKFHDTFKTGLILNIADIYVRQGNLKKALQYLNNVNPDKLYVRELYFFYLKVQGERYFLEGDYINAELNLMELVSLVRQEKIFFTKHYSEAIVILSELFNTLGRTQSAIDLCEGEVRFLKKRGMENSSTFLNLRLTLLGAQASYNILNTEETMEQISQIEDSLIRFVNPKHPLFIKSNALKGTLAFKNKDYDNAISYFHKAIEVANLNHIDEMQYQRVSVIDRAGMIYIEKGELPKALEEYRQLKGKFTEESVYWPGLLGRIAYIKALLGEWEEARELAMKGVDMRINQYDTQLKYTSEDEKINYIHHTGGVFDYFFSLMAMSEGFKSSEMVEKCYDLQLNYRKYFLKEAIARKKKIEKLEGYRDDMNFTGYVSNLDRQKSQLATANFFSVKERSDLHIDTYLLTDRINNLEKSLSFASKAKVDSLKVAEYLSWKDVQSKLQEKEVAVEIIKLTNVDPSESFYVAIAITSDCKTPKFIPIGNANLMEKELFDIYTKEIQPRTRSLVYKKKTNTKKVYAYDHYWLPIKRGLKELSEDIDKIYLSKDGIYNAVNLNALFNAQDKRYLIEEFDINLVISTADINRNKSQSEFANHEICLFGNPVFEENRDGYGVREVDESTAESEEYSFYLENLPGTKRELENTANLFESKGWHINSYYQNDATEGNIKHLSYSPSIMHIATHGIYIDDMINPILRNPLLKSGLFFTEISTNKDKDLQEIYDSGNDGILTAYEVKDLNLKNTELLILSACQSGVSEIADGDGVSGLQYAFSIAGVKTIIMSLWSVDDNATQKLMNEFYKQWFELKDIDLAFRKAQLELMKEYRDPYYWGAFVLVH